MPSPVRLMVLRNCFGMIMSVSTLIILSGAATPSKTVNLSMSHSCNASIPQSRRGRGPGVRLCAVSALAAIAEQCGFPRPACGERATCAERKPDLGPVRGRFRKLRLAEAPPHPDLLPACGEKETAVRPGH